MRNYIDSALLTSSLGLEAMADLTSAQNVTADELTTLLGDFSPATQNKMHAIIKGYRSPLMESNFVDDEIKKKDFYAKTSIGLEKAATDFATKQSKFITLPDEVKRLLEPLRNRYVAVENARAQLGTHDKNNIQYQKLTYQMEQSKLAMEHVLFNTFANMEKDRQDRKNITGEGMEGYNYTNAIFYPKLEAMVQWINTAATIYSKVIKIKQLLNETTSIPVHTQEVDVIFLDKQGNEIDRMKREDFYANMIPKNPNAFQTLDRTLKLQKADFVKKIYLRKDVLSGYTAPFLTAHELVRMDFMITNMQIGTALVDTGTVYDYNAGCVLSETFSEIDLKGKMVPFQLDPNKPDEVYYISIFFDGSEQVLVVTTNKSKPTMDDIENIDFNFKLHDIAQVQKSNLDFQLRHRRTFINAGALGRIDVPLSQPELERLDDKLGGSFIGKITNLTSEYIANSKDKTFLEGYQNMMKSIKAHYQQNPNKILYAEQNVDLAIEKQVFKTEAFNLYLGSIFKNLISRLDVSANSNTHTQLNIFTHTLHLDVIDPALQIITGQVDEDTNGKFLGVAQDARVFCLTLGHDTSSPVSSIVVGTDKNDLKASAFDSSNNPLPIGDIEYDYHILPYYKETNLETNLLVETATRVISDNSVRSNRNTYIPAMIITYSSKWQTLREAGATLKIKGYHIAAV